ncbi:PA0069 family radical SAM protein [Stratiformator vulcanicus]|uniref:Radical SAM superfamily protein n=1 Tax=Stratiformator vulcanicus TaxID=2527980 RepID=A0A517R6Y7_9PLAN|nr:PA0069 family radical SAM protein [Stratiformator vulcanicus]QDT39612.1 Radical SAM superfamily protein [Stratiformator vulcanicus]
MPKPTQTDIKASGDTLHGRGSSISPPNRFDKVIAVPDFEHDAIAEEDGRNRPETRFLADTSRSVVSENDSPDIPFRYSLNPYRGCEHGCSYCYARTSHEYLGHNAGIDFETLIYVKQKAPQLFRLWLARPKYEPAVVAFSGVTDCYQPAERHFQLTRQCLEVAAVAGQPISIVTKNALVLRDIDILRKLATRRLVHVTLSVTSLDPELARSMEPRTSTPKARLRAIEQLSAAGIPVRVSVAPVIPGLNDSELPAILMASSEAGAIHASLTMLRLPGSVLPVFRDWLARHRPNQTSKVEARIRDMRGGRWNESRFGDRLRGLGLRAEQIQATFQLFSKRYGLTNTMPAYDLSVFRPPVVPGGQKTLF